MANIQKAIDELHIAFTKLNDGFFEGYLPEPAITIQSGGKRKSMGWCSTKEVWQDKEGKNKRYELNIGAEYLDIDFMETMDTMLHEMVHLYNAIQGVQDCSRNGTYHNKRFKAECEQRGFYFPNEKDERYGWAFPKLTEESKQKIKGLDINEKAFVIARRSGSSGAATGSDEGTDSEEKKKTSYKWVCPGCGVIVRSTKPEIALKCMTCDQQLEEDK
ncbi:SprT-like domain-containing protein [Fictibacillus sp. WQ 8-8]|uniref:SprT-like domain-containing protein n=1 Tax=Fictibacillus sp. WQ 8-8 TaxID=2938788 RepID=UPI00210DD83D|nr:SprT-like domain-containing protein [Fictibacillus sp. WQ 8-8]MCQ6267854.1 SprT-like domain-containing protein [Fictibacillus sp. WQ 8-8]